MAPVKIGIIGDFNPNFITHVAMEPAAKEAAERIGIDVDVKWIPTPALDSDERDEILGQFDALWAAAASPYESFDGMLYGIEFARTRKIPFTGT
jgi:CTP synthase (UTP-ammonia lyase)